MIKVTLPDQSVTEYEAGVTLGQVLRNWKAPLVKSTVAGKVGQDSVDMSHPLLESVTVAFVEASSKEGLNILRHSISHVMPRLFKRASPAPRSASVRLLRTVFIMILSTKRLLPRTICRKSRNGCVRLWLPITPLPGRR